MENVFFLTYPSGLFLKPTFEDDNAIQTQTQTQIFIDITDYIFTVFINKINI